MFLETRGVGSPGAEVTGSCELPEVVLGIEFGPSATVISALNC